MVFIHVHNNKVISWFGISVEVTAFEAIEAQFSQGQSLEIPRNGIVSIDPPVSTKQVKIMLKSGQTSGLGRITIRTVGELEIVVDCFTIACYIFNFLWQLQNIWKSTRVSICLHLCYHPVIKRLSFSIDKIVSLLRKWCWIKTNKTAWSFCLFDSWNVLDLIKCDDNWNCCVLWGWKWALECRSKLWW